MSMFTTSDPLLSSSQMTTLGFPLFGIDGSSLGPLSPPWDDDDLMDFKLSDEDLSPVNDIEDLLSCSPNSLSFDNEVETDESSSSSFGVKDDEAVASNDEISLATLSEMFQPESNDTLWTQSSSSSTNEEMFSLDPTDPIWDVILEKVNILDGNCDEKQDDLVSFDSTTLLKTKETNSQLCLPAKGQNIFSSCILIEDSSEGSLKTFVDQGYCSVCKVCFQSQELLKSHQMEFLRKNVCCQCKKKLDNASKLKNHWRKHNKEKPFQCKWCDKYYSQKNSLVRHQNLYCELAKHQKHEEQNEVSINHIHSSFNLRLIPDDDFFHSENREALNRSKHYHPLDSLSQNRLKGASIPPLKMHKIKDKVEPPSSSGGNSTTICLICKKNFFDVKSLENHRTHYQNHKSCCSCNKVMASRSKLMIHCRSHTKELPLTCNICNRSFAERSTLRKHISTHGEKNFQCEHCGKAFARKDYLTKHSQVHRQLYKCSQCTFQCFDAGEIELHLQVHQVIDQS